MLIHKKKNNLNGIEMNDIKLYLNMRISDIIQMFDLKLHSNV